MARAISALGAGMANVFVTLAPEVFILGGGIAAAGSQLLDPLLFEVRRRVSVAPPDDIRIVQANLGRVAGAVGAALIAGRS